MGVEMPVIDITTFTCCKCGNLIPDRLLENVRVHSTGDGVSMTCPECDEAEREAAEMDLFYDFLPLRKKANLYIDGDNSD
jgi:RNase P subunit RPR2